MDANSKIANQEDVVGSDFTRITAAAATVALTPAQDNVLVTLSASSNGITLPNVAQMAGRTVMIQGLGSAVGVTTIADAGDAAPALSQELSKDRPLRAYKSNGRTWFPLVYYAPAT